MFIGTETYFVLVRTSSSSPFLSFHGFALYFFFLSVALVYVGTSDRTGTFVCGMFVKCIFVVKCEALHFFTGFSTFIVLHAPRRCLPHVASSNEVCACSSQEAILFRHYRTRFVQPIGKYFSLLIFDRSMMPEILKTAWKQDRN